MIAGSIKFNFFSANCGPEEFQCHNGKCLSIDKRCNGKPECSNGEDEVNCGIPGSDNFPSFGTGTILLYTSYEIYNLLHYCIGSQIITYILFNIPTIKTNCYL